MQVWSWSGPEGLEPVLEGLDKQDHPVTALQYLPSTGSLSHALLSGNVKGELNLSRIETDVEGFKLTCEKISDFAKAPVTCMDLQVESGQLLVASEEGTIGLLDIQAEKMTVKAKKASESTLNCAKWISPSSFIVASHASEILVYDHRISHEVPSLTIKERVDAPTSIDRRVWSIDNNPARPWLVGSAVSGPSLDLRPTVMFHDLRAAQHPVLQNQSLHIGHIWKINFHPDQPDLVLTASDDGTLLMWDTTAAFNATSSLKPASIATNIQRKQNVKRLRNDGLPINHFQIDTLHNLVISSSDSESITFNVDLL